MDDNTPDQSSNGQLILIEWDYEWRVGRGRVRGGSIAQWVIDKVELQEVR